MPECSHVRDTDTGSVLGQAVTPLFPLPLKDHFFGKNSILGLVQMGLNLLLIVKRQCHFFW